MPNPLRDRAKPRPIMKQTPGDAPLVPTLMTGERQPGESDLAVLAFNAWLRLGALRQTTELHRRVREGLIPALPTDLTINMLYKWSGDYAWAARAAAYDARLDAERTARYEAQRKAIMDDPLTQPWGRLVELRTMYRKLRTLAYEQDATGRYVNMEWDEEGKFGTRHVVNTSLVEQLRALLDDIARETGGRKTITEDTKTYNIDDATRAMIERVYGQSIADNTPLLPAPDDLTIEALDALALPMPTFNDQPPPEPPPTDPNILSSNLDECEGVDDK